MKGKDSKKADPSSSKDGYFVDSRLLPRIAEYIEDQKLQESNFIDFDQMTTSIQKRFPEYQRKKFNVFRQAVMKAFEYLTEKKRKSNRKPSLDELETTHVKRRKKEAEKEELPKSSSSVSSDTDEEPDFEMDTNSLNTLLTGMYSPRSTATNASATPADDTQAESKSQQRKSPQKKVKKSAKKKATTSATPSKSKLSGFQLTESKVKFEDIGGNDNTLNEICKLLLHMRHPEVYTQIGVTPPRGFLLVGPPGSGKTLLAHAIAGELDMPFLKIAAPEVVSGVSGESEEKVREMFTQAMQTSPCVLFIDEIDSVTPKREQASKDMERRIVSQLLSCLDELNARPDLQVLVIGATNRPDALDPALRRAGRFDREISLGIPDEKARISILQVLCRNLKLDENFNFEEIAKLSPGYVGADMNSLVREAALAAINRVFNALEACSFNSAASESETVVASPAEPPYKQMLSWLRDAPPLSEEQIATVSITMDDFRNALKIVQPSAKREGFATIPDVTWEDIGALHAVREELSLAILAPVRYQKEFQCLGLLNSPGILLAGPPGCGKTLLAKAIANETGINFISVKGPELMNMYVGESEKAVRQVFQRARNSVPCVIFFDEIDALCPKRSDFAEGGSSARVVNQLLTEMDGLEARKAVFIIGATNRPDIIDPAILRPGRLDKIMYVGLPSEGDRLEILRTITKNGERPKLAPCVDLQRVSADPRAQRFTGADLSALVREASIAALKEHIQSSGSSDLIVRSEHFEYAFDKIKPSVSAKDQLFYDKMKEKCINLK